MAAAWIALAGLALSAMQGAQQQGQGAASRGQAAASDRQKTLAQGQDQFQPTATSSALQPQQETPAPPPAQTTPPAPEGQRLQEAIGQAPFGSDAPQQQGGSNWLGGVQQAANLGATVQGLMQQSQGNAQQRVQSMLASRQQPQMQAYQPTANQFQQQIDPRLQMLLRAQGGMM